MESITLQTSLFIAISEDALHSAELQSVTYKNIATDMNALAGQNTPKICNAHYYIPSRRACSHLHYPHRYNTVQYGELTATSTPHYRATCAGVVQRPPRFMSEAQQPGSTHLTGQLREHARRTANLWQTISCPVHIFSAQGGDIRQSMWRGIRIVDLRTVDRDGCRRLC
jgi:hypothetical protein